MCLKQLAVEAEAQGKMQWCFSSTPLVAYNVPGVTCGGSWLRTDQLLTPFKHKTLFARPDTFASVSDLSCSFSEAQLQRSWELLLPVEYFLSIIFTY